MKVRSYRPDDERALYEICLRTGNHGHDASKLYDDARLLGHIYVGPYLAFAPEFAFVLESKEGTPVGYVVGALDTEQFSAWCEERWWPALRRRYDKPNGAAPAGQRTLEQELAAFIHTPRVTPSDITCRYPSHLHIDLLPAAQGQGYGRKLMDRLLSALAEAGSTGVHLGVAPQNERAIGFYRHLGFAELNPGFFVRELTVRQMTAELLDAPPSPSSRSIESSSSD